MIHDLTKGQRDDCTNGKDFWIGGEDQERIRRGSGEDQEDVDDSVLKRN